MIDEERRDKEGKDGCKKGGNDDQKERKKQRLVKEEIRKK